MATASDTFDGTGALDSEVWTIRTGAPARVNGAWKGSTQNIDHEAHYSGIEWSPNQEATIVVGGNGSWGSGVGGGPMVLCSGTGNSRVGYTVYCDNSTTAEVYQIVAGEYVFMTTRTLPSGPVQGNEITLRANVDEEELTLLFNDAQVGEAISIAGGLTSGAPGCASYHEAEIDGWSAEDDAGASVNTSPAKPSITASDATHAAVDLASSAFSDADGGDTHAASQWQIDLQSGDFSSPVWDSGEDTEHLTSFSSAGLGSLDPEEDYQARVRHKDDSGDGLTEWSDWSDPDNFSTTAAPSVSIAAVRFVINALGGF